MVNRMSSKRVVASGRKLSDVRRQNPRRVVDLPGADPKRRSVADGPSPSSARPTDKAKPGTAQRSPGVPPRTDAQARRDANNVRVVAESLREPVFFAMLQRGAPELARIYSATKAKSRGCGGCGMKSLFRMIHDEIGRRRGMVALADAVKYLSDRGWA
jgi:hypothetical protein